MQNSLNVSEIKLPLASDIILLGIPCSEKKLYMLVSSWLLIGLLSFWLLGTCYDSLQYKDNFCYIERTCLQQQFHMVYPEFHGGLTYPKVVEQVFILLSMSVFMPIH